MQSLASKHPDVKSHHIIAVLAMRGDLGRAAVTKVTHLPCCGVASFPGPARLSLAVRNSRRGLFRTATNKRAGPGNEASSGASEVYHELTCACDIFCCFVPPLLVVADTV